MTLQKPIIEDINFSRIQETEKYILGNIWDQSYLFDKVKKREFLLCAFYGEPDCGVINDSCNWSVVGGDIIAIWNKQKVSIIEADELKWVYDVRIKDSNTVEILIDPWSNNSSVWELEIDSLKYKKICDFEKYKEKPYTDDVEW
jgi:hypothetical protein